MLSKQKSMTVSGTSTVKVDGKDTPVMTMNATVSENGSVSNNKYIQDKAVYLANKTEVDADCVAFDEYLNSLLEV